MDTSTTIIGLVILFISVLPIILAVRNRSKKERQFKNAFFQKGKANGLLINEQEIWRETAIGIDKQIKRLFYMKTSGEQEEETVETIDLKMVKKCEILNVSKTINTSNGQESLTEKLALKFLYKDARNKETILDFYDYKRTPQLDYDHQRIQKWQGIISNEIAR